MKGKSLTSVCSFERKVCNMGIIILNCAAKLQKKNNIHKSVCHFLRNLFIFCPEGVVLLAEVGDDDGEGGDTHLGRCRVPAPYLDAEFETEIVDSEVNGYDEDIAQELSPTIKLGGRECDVFLQPKAGEKGDWEDNAKGRNVRRDCLGKLKMENGKLKIN